MAVIRPTLYSTDPLEDSTPDVPLVRVPRLSEQRAPGGDVNQPVVDHGGVRAVEERQLAQVLRLVVHQRGERLHPLRQRDRRRVALQGGVYLRMPIAAFEATGRSEEH